jgi:hypothetical protein
MKLTALAVITVRVRAGVIAGCQSTIHSLSWDATADAAVVDIEHPGGALTTASGNGCNRLPEGSRCRLLDRLSQSSRRDVQAAIGWLSRQTISQARPSCSMPYQCFFSSLKLIISFTVGRRRALSMSCCRVRGHGWRGISHHKLLHCNGHGDCIWGALQK